MRTGGREALWELIASHLAAQTRYEREASFSGLQAGLLFLPFAAAAWLAKQNANPYWHIIMWIAAAIPLLALLQWALTQARLRRLHDGEYELRGYLHSVIFEYELWLELLDEERGNEYSLGPLQLARTEASFADRMARLFRDYPKLAGAKSLQPFPAWYRRMYRSGSQRNNRYVDHFWQFALAQLLSEEFFDTTPRGVIV